jgi:NADH-quinone oxidoreductase subunit K
VSALGGTNAGATATGVPLAPVLILAGALFAIGLGGLLIRRNALIMLICIEVMLNAASLAFVAAGSRWGADGQVMFLFILAVAAAEVAVGLALVLGLDRQHHTLDADAADELGG